MEGLEHLLNPGEIFSNVTIYNLDRTGGQGRVFIFVHQVLAGEGKGLFIAYPTLIVGQTKAEYMITGDTHEEALQKCLEAIKAVPIEEMINLKP
jgi:hypothetical protein